MSTQPFRSGLDLLAPSPLGTGPAAAQRNFRRLGSLAIELATVNPDVDDDSDADFAAGSVWYNTATGVAWICQDPAVGAAVWRPLFLGGGVVELGSVSGGVTIDAAAGSQFRMVLGGDVTFATPSHPTDGQTIQLRVQQDGTGGRGLSFAVGTGGFVRPNGWDGILSGPGQITWISAQYDEPAGLWRLFTPDLEGYTPTGIPGLVMWLDATQIAGVADGATIATWPDASGNGNDATQSTGGQRPTYYSTTNPINGRPYLWFDDTDDNMATGLSLSGDYTIVVVERPHTITAAHRTINASPANGLIATSRPAIYSSCCALVGQISDNPLSGTDARIGIMRNTNPCTFHVNGVDRTTATNTGYDWPNLHLGPNAAAAETANTDIAEVLIYDHALTTPEREAVQTYLAQKWGITL